MPASMATFVLGVPAITFEISSSFSSGVHTLLNTLCFKTSGPFSYMPFESIGIQPLWDVRIRTRMIQFNTHHFKLITITHKNTLLTDCPVKRVHIRKNWRFLRMLKVRKRTNCTKTFHNSKKGQVRKSGNPSLFGDGVFSKKPRPQTEIDSFCLLQILSKHGSLNQ